MRIGLPHIIMTTLLTHSLTASAALEVDYASFLASHDMTWNRIPNRWEVAPYTGNGMVGFLFYQGKNEAKNVISIHAGRHDYYDHRVTGERDEHMWILRGRLPLGHFELTSQGDITGVDLRVDLWNAELTGTIQTTKGAYRVRGLSHSEHDVIYFETNAADGESVEITWHPEVPYSSTRKSLEQGGGPKGGVWEARRTMDYPLPPEPTLSEADGMRFCLQALHEHRGETTTGWEIIGKADGRQVLTASIHHSFPERDSLERVKSSLLKAREMLGAESTPNAQQKNSNIFLSSHRDWWHDYYPQSFLTLSDPEKEAFYWIQMYKLGSSMRQDGPIQDLMGPWYHSTFWPMVWGNLNVQLQYWTHLVANRMGVGESLPNNLDKYAKTLERNVPEHWQDSTALGPCFPQNFESYSGGKFPDMLAWILHNYWLHCEYAGDRERMRDGLFPLLRKTVNSYLNYFKDNPVESDDGKIHIKSSWSPEYPGGHGQDINFSIALCRWACQTLLDLNAEHGLNDPLEPAWQNIVDNLVDWQIDENGLRIGRDIAFEKPHRHYSHLLGFYPLALITPEKAADRKMLRKTLDHWLDVSIHSQAKKNPQSSHCTGYTATGASSMYAWLGDGRKAMHYLDYFIDHRLVSPTTMYAEGNPVIETPFTFATCLHDILLQSHGRIENGRLKSEYCHADAGSPELHASLPESPSSNLQSSITQSSIPPAQSSMPLIRVFPAVPEAWKDVAFHQFRAQGAFLVSAKRAGGVTQFVEVISEAGSPCRVQVDVAEPVIAINGEAADECVRALGHGMYEIELKRGDSVTFTHKASSEATQSITAIPVPEDRCHLFGLNDKTTRLAGHGFYYPEGAEK